MWRVFLWVTAIAVSAVAQGSQSDPVVLEMADDYFTTGSSVRIQKSVSGDLFAAGGNVNIRAKVRGDSVAAGGDVRLESPIQEGQIYAAGGRVLVNSEVGRNTRIAGGSVELGPQAKIHGNASLVGGQVDVPGTIGGYLQAGGGRVYLNGPITGDVHVTARDLELGPEARIQGKLRYLIQNELKRDPAAQTRGGIEHLSPSRPALQSDVGRSFACVMGIAWGMGLMILAALFVGVMPGVATRISASVTSRPGMDLLLGFVALVCIPAAVLLLFITVVGLPLGVLFILSYFALLLVGFVATGMVVGDLTLKRTQPEHAAQLSWRIGAAVVGVMIILLLSRIPLLGGLIGLLALLLGSGTIISQFGPFRSTAVTRS